MSLIDYWLSFSDVRMRRRLRANVQSMYYAILARFNAAHYPLEMELSYRELETEAGLVSSSTAYSAVNELKQLGLIGLRKEAGRLVVQLKPPVRSNSSVAGRPERPANASRTQAEQRANTSRTPPGDISLPSTKELKKEKETQDAPATAQGGNDDELDWRSFVGQVVATTVELVESEA